MGRYQVRFGALLVLAALVGCSDYDKPADAPVTNGTLAGAPKSVHTQGLGNTSQPQHESINRFAADLGPNPGQPVPQGRGQDKRPASNNRSGFDQVGGALTVTPSGALILYDATGSYGWLGELYGIGAVTLASHFGTTVSKPVGSYVAGDLAKYKAVIYVGSTYDEPLPVAFLDDVLASTSATQVVWIYDNIWQLANRSTGFVTKYGYNPWIFDTAAVATVTYKGTVLTRDTINGAGLMTFSPFNAAVATTLATAKRADGTTLPWAVRSSNLTYITENPFAYISHDDRYLAFCDMLFDALDPTAATRHRALVRLEDVSPEEDATAFTAIVDYLYSQAVPFSVALIPQYTDPKGYYNGGKAMTTKWTDTAATAMKNAIKYASTHGGTLVMHGFTHQYSNVNNPYSGVTGDDFEFWLAHVDAATNNVVYDGKIPGDSSTWATGRINSGLSAMSKAGFVTPTIFEFPHYAGSPTDAKAIKLKFASAYHRGLFFSGGLGINPENLTHSVGLFYPYKVTDIYGWKTIPENIGNYEPEAYNNHPPRLAADLVKTATNNLVIRDGVASLFFHPYYPLSALQATVSGIKAAGYTFVSPAAL